MTENTLKELGWDASLEKEFRENTGFTGLEPARIIAEHKERYVAATRYGEMPAEVTGKFEYTAAVPSDFPKTGDWVAANIFKDEGKAIIHAVLPRRTVFSRKAAGAKAEEQVIAANLDALFIVQGLDNNYNRMRLLRYIAAVKGSGIEPVVVLNKSDVNPEAEKIKLETIELVKPVPVLLVSAKNSAGLGGLKDYMKPGKTFAFAGSSGAGKSTIINSIAGQDIAATSEVREDDSRGRHTTVSRQLYSLGEHGLLIDTPGMRELSLWNESGVNDLGFDVVSEHAQKCRYADCTHEHEPGCAVKEAAGRGLIPAEIMESYYKLRREAEYTASKTDINAAQKRKAKDKILGRLVNDVSKRRKEKRGG